MSEERQGKGELRSKAIVLRALANYINAFGGSAYVLPARLVPRHRTFAPHVFDDGELSRLFAEVDRASREGFGAPAVPEMYSVALRLTYVCGLRPGEGIRARVSELDPEPGTLRITKAKSHKERIVALSEDMRRRLRSHVRNLAAAAPGSEYLFPDENRERPVGLPEVRSFFTRCWRRVCRADDAGCVPRARLYDLRHRRNASPHTIRAYSQAIRHLLEHVATSNGKSIAEVTFADIDGEAVSRFLGHLERCRNRSTATRNHRLKCIRAFYSYAAEEEPSVVACKGELGKVTFKRAAAEPALKYASESDIALILNAPDAKTAKGRRDRALMSFLYDTGARVQGVLNVRVSDVQTNGTPTVMLFGQGRKQGPCQ